MAQIKIYGIKEQLNPIKMRLSETIHNVVVEVLSFPKEKRFHRFFPMDKENILYGEGRSEAYTIIEIMMIEGRAIDTKKELIKRLFVEIDKKVGISPQDLEISIQEAPSYQWGFRGMCGDEVVLNYKVDI